MRIRRLDGRAATEDPAERAAYWRCLLDRLWWQDPESWWDYTLLPGLLPAELWEHMRREADHTSGSAA